MATAQEGLDVLAGAAAPRVLGVFAHPDDEVFCVGGALAHWKHAGATTALLSLTRGEAGQIRDASIATRRTLGAVRARELRASAHALGVDAATCLDLGDGTLESRLGDGLADIVAEHVLDVDPDVVVTFGLDGGYGHPDHVASARATAEALADLGHPARLLQARFPMSDQLLLDVIVRWLRTLDDRFAGSSAFGHALKLFADGSSMLGFAADHINVEWFPIGSFIIEQGESARELYCVLSGTIDILVEDADGQIHWRDSSGPGSFVGEDGIASGRPRNAHVVAREDVTCLVLSPQAHGVTQGRGGLGLGPPSPAHDHGPGREYTSLPYGAVSVDVDEVLDAKVAALAAHRSQYALSLDLFPRTMLHEMLGVEHFVAVDPAAVAEASGTAR